MWEKNAGTGNNVWVRVSQVKPSNCFNSIEKLVFPSIFDTLFSSYMM